MTDHTDETWIDETGASTLASIKTMVEAASVDYDRLDELRDIDEPSQEEAAELEALESAAGDCDGYDDAANRIYEDPLSIMVRSGWSPPGEPMEPEEFEILLSTGGPATRIYGQLNQYGEPESAILQVQNWGTPWIDYSPPGARDIALEYARYFNFS